MTVDPVQPELLWVFDYDGSQIGPIHDMTGLYEENKLLGEEVLYFQTRKNDPKSEWIKSDRMISYNGNRYRVGPFTDSRDAGPVRTVECRALWYDLGDDIRFGTFSILGKNTAEGLSMILLETGWSIGVVEGDLLQVHSYEASNVSVLQLIRSWAAVCNLEPKFDTSNKTVSLVTSVGQVRGVGFRYGRNIDSIEKKFDPPQATRLWAIGANELTFAGVSVDGKPYVENYDWYVSQGMDLSDAKAQFEKGMIWQDDRYLLALSLYDAAIEKLVELSQPTISYSLTAMDLSAFTGVQDEFEVGDIVYVLDEELSVDISVRIVRTVKRPYEPWDNTVELSYLRPGLSLDGISSSSSGVGTDFKLLVDESDSDVLSSALRFPNRINLTTVGISNGVIGADLSGIASGSGILRMSVLLDGSVLGNEHQIPFTNGQTVSESIATWYAGVEEGDHSVSVQATIVGAGTIALGAGCGRLYVMATGVLGGNGGGGVSNIVAGDIVEDKTGWPTDSQSSDLIPDVTSGDSEIVPDESFVPTISTPTILIV